MNDMTKLKAAGLAPTVGEILQESDEDRAARERAAVHANEPEENAVDALRKQVDDVYDEALLWIDGTKVANQDQADALGTLYKALDDAYKLAESERVAAKKPHDDAAAAVQREFKPIVDKADKARKAVKVAIQRWNDHLAELQRAEAERVRREAEEAARKAQEELASAHAMNNLAAIEQAEQSIGVASELADMASRAEKAKAVTQTGGARGIGKVPTRWVGRLDADPLDLEATRTAEHALMSHYWKTQRAWLVAILVDAAQSDIRAGARVIPGMSINQEKVA